MKFLNKKHFLSPLLLCLFSACATTDGNRTGVAERTVADSPIEITDPLLSNLIIEFLATDTRGDSTTEALRRRVQAALAAYRPNERAMVRVRRDGDTFVLPLQFVGLAKSDSLSPSPAFGTGIRIGGAALRGDILDMIPVAGDSRCLVILFADSVVTATLSGGRVVSLRSATFPENSLARIRGAFPAGRMVLAAKGGVALLTTNLRAPLIFMPRSGRVRQVSSSDLVRRPVHPTSWFATEGRGLFYSRMGGLPPFRALLPLPSGRLVLLDESGYLRVFAPGGRRPVWSSERAWGSRFFDLNAGRFAVCDGRNNVLVIFAAAPKGLRLLGESPAFEGAVKAVTAGSLFGGDGLFVAVSSSSARGAPLGRLRFIPNSEAQWRRPARAAEPRFPDYARDLTFIPRAQDFSASGSGEKGLPGIVSAQSFETLFQLEPGGGVRPAVAASARSDTAANVWHIRLRPGVRFSDGSLLTAAAVKQSWERRWRRSAEMNSSARRSIRYFAGSEAFLRGVAAGVTGIQVVDELNLRVVLARPRRFLPELLAQPWFAVDKEGGEGRPLGTGPFQIVERRNSGGRTIFECRRNESYRGGAPPLRAVKFVLDAGNVVDAISTAGEACALIRNPRDLDYFRQLESFRTMRLPGQEIYFVALNPRSGPLANEVARRRLGGMFENEEIAGLISAAECKTATGLLTTEGMRVKMRMPPRSRAGGGPALKVAFRVGDGVARQIAERLVARITQTGVRSLPPWPLSPARLDSLRRSGAYDILVDSYTPHFSTPAYDLLDLLDRGYALGSLAAETVMADFQNDPEAAAQKVEQRLIEAALLIPLLRATTYVVLPRDLHGVALSATSPLDLSRAWVPQ